MPTMNRLQVMMALGFALSMLAGCEQKGPAEKAGEKVDKAVDQAEKKIKEVTK
jgi:hyperosmotically inducible protein